jgi:hypothetical protein
VDANEVPAIPQAEAAEKSEQFLRDVLKDGPKVVLDHHLVYHAREFSLDLLASLALVAMASCHGVSSFFCPSTHFIFPRL